MSRLSFSHHAAGSPLWQLLVVSLLVMLCLSSHTGLVAAQGGEEVTHTIQAGETLADIATTYSVSIEALMAANDLTDPNMIFAGATLIIPDMAATDAEAAPTGETIDPLDAPIEPQDATVPPATATPDTTGTPSTTDIYVVQPGDTLATIASAYNIDLAQLIANNFAEGENPGLIFPGQVLIVPGGVPDGQGGGGGANQNYTVRAGDMLDTIASAFNVAIESLIYANDIPFPYRIYPGDVLVIPGNAPAYGVMPARPDEGIIVPVSAEASTNAATEAIPAADDATADGQGGRGDIYIVQEADTLAGIATTFGIDVAALLAANAELFSDIELEPGSELIVP